MELTPSRLTLARQRRGLTLVALSKNLKHATKPRTLSSYENGTTAPSPEALSAIASVLNFPIEFFTADDIPQANVEGVSFRALTKMTAAQRDISIATATLAATLNSWLSDEFNLPPADVPELDPAIMSRLPKDRLLKSSLPEAAASHVRSTWGLGEQPISNMIHLAEAHGIRIFAVAPECRDVDAFSFWMDGTPFVCVDPSRTPERVRFDVAHEIGHLVMHQHGTPNGRQAELEANRFASCLLMPEVDVKASSPRYPTFDALVQAKKRWKVSVAALNFRLHELGIISDWHYRELCIEIARYGRHREPESIPEEHSHVLTTTFSKLRSDGIRREDVARLSHIFPRDLEALIDGLTVTGIDGGGESTPAVEDERPQLRLVR